MRARPIVVTGLVATVASVVGSLTLGRSRLLGWGATPDEIADRLPGDDLLPDPDLVATRAISIGAPASAVWPWLLQMGSGRGGLYTYDWIENLVGLDMHSVDVLVPEFQDRGVGDVEQLGRSGPRLVVEVVDPERALVLRSDDGHWVWAFCLEGLDRDRCRLISRNRISLDGSSLIARFATALLMESGSLLMERKMLLGIKERSERLWADASRRGSAADAA